MSGYDDASESAGGAGGGPCVRCGRTATRSCFLYSSRSHGGAVPGGIIDGETGVPTEENDVEAELFGVCESCIGQELRRRRYVGISAAGILLFFGSALFIGAYGDGRVVALALAFAGLIWGGWTLLDTYDARDEIALRIAKDEALSYGRLMSTAEELGLESSPKPREPGTLAN